MHWTNSKKIMWTPGCSVNSSWIWLPHVQHICKCILYPKLKSIYVSGHLHMILSLAISGISTIAVVWIAECDLKRKSSNNLGVREYFVYYFNNPYCQYEFIILELQLKLITFRWKSIHSDLGNDRIIIFIWSHMDILFCRVSIPSHEITHTLTIWQSTAISPCVKLSRACTCSIWAPANLNGMR